MSYYENSQWSAGSGQNNWEHQTPPIRTGTTGPTPQDEFAFSYQFDEVDRAYENLSKSGKTYGMSGRHSRGTPSSTGSRPHNLPEFGDASRGHPSANLQGFYTNQRHQPSRGSNEAEQVMQAKRRMAAQRERELRNLHTEQQYQRTAVVSEVTYNAKSMSEEETRDLIARQRSALYKEGPFAEKAGYVDETGNVRPGAPAHSGPTSLRGASPLQYELGRNAPSADSGALGSGTQTATQEHGSRPSSNSSPQPQPNSNGNGSGNGSGHGSKGVFEAPANRASTSSPGGSPSDEFSAGSKPATVAPIGTRPSGTPATTTAAKRSTTPLASPGGWGRGGWPQSSGLGSQTSVWA